MSKGWMRVREAAALLTVSESTVRRRIGEGQLRGRTGKSGRQEVFVPAKLRATAQTDPSSKSTTQKVTASLATASAAPQTNADASSTTQQTAQDRSDAVSDSPDDQVKRYERLAGGSLMLAQKRADELAEAASVAYENLAHARQQLRQVRKVAIAGWGLGAFALVLAFVLSLAFGLDSARSQAQAQASMRDAEVATQRVADLRDDLARVRESMATGHDAHASVPTEPR